MFVGDYAAAYGEGWYQMEADAAKASQLPDVSGRRLVDLVESRDPALADALQRLVAELPEPGEPASTWPSFLRPGTRAA